ncbi:hypothetical protein BZA05DRAFT_452025 [Tricharina praecox]|uniref:uncharacterized protein n=1 Tax=Tricharina praecox TaxID=43433 RepID=UPI00221F96BB|nr:uncharacterized protein BZA05DRAFT_452025 [Tricharina praecox]KAI5852104.1 hypothetical protein BZA05DRAFT_452025 [Tricharina praecox]
MASKNTVQRHKRRRKTSTTTPNGLSSLPAEIILIVLSNLSRSDFYNLCLVSKLFHTYTTPYLYRSVDIVLSGSSWDAKEHVYNSLSLENNRGLRFITNFRFLPPPVRHKRRVLGRLGPDAAKDVQRLMGVLLSKVGPNVLQRFEWYLPSLPLPEVRKLLHQEALTKVSWSISGRLCHNLEVPQFLFSVDGRASPLASVTIISIAASNIDHIRAWLSQCPALKVLRLEWNPRIRYQFLERVPRGCFWTEIGLHNFPRLTTLKLKWTNVTYLHRLPVVDRLTSLVIDRCQGLGPFLNGWRRKSTPSPIRLRKLWIHTNDLSFRHIHDFLHAFTGLHELALYSGYTPHRLTYVSTGIRAHRGTLSLLALDTLSDRFGSRFAASHVPMVLEETALLATDLQHYPHLRALALPADLGALPDLTIAALAGRVQCFQIHLRAARALQPLAQAIANAVARGFAGGEIDGDIATDLDDKPAFAQSAVRSLPDLARIENERNRLQARQSTEPKTLGMVPRLRYLSLFTGALKEWVVVFEVERWAPFPPVVRKVRRREVGKLEMVFKVLRENLV